MDKLLAYGLNLKADNREAKKRGDEGERQVREKEEWTLKTKGNLNKTSQFLNILLYVSEDINHFSYMLINVQRVLYLFPSNLPIPLAL